MQGIPLFLANKRSIVIKFDNMKRLMNKLLWIFSLVIVTTVSAQQPITTSVIPLNRNSDHPKLIVRADDMGSSHSANVAIRRSYKEGIVSSVEVMAVTPWFPEAVKFLEKDKDIDVGLHLTITSEWDNVKWKPLTFWHSLVDSNGYFYPMKSVNVNYPKQSLEEAEIDIQELEFELRAQIEFAIRRIPRISHLTDHMGFTQLNEQWLSVVLKLATEYNLPFELNNHKHINLEYGGPSTSYREKKASFIKMLNTLESGNTYLFIDHPGIDNSELQAIHHKGYENVATDRQGVTDLFTSNKVKRTIKKRNIEIINYKVLVEEDRRLKF